jgi:hypothetical protein
MMSGALAPTPIIAVGAAADLEQRWIERVVDLWLAALGVQATAVNDNIHDFLKSSGGIGYNPLAQTRWATRARSAFGSALLDLRLKPGKRGAFEIAVDYWCPDRSPYAIVAKASDAKADWIYGRRLWAYRTRNCRQMNGGGGVIAALSRHSLVRLVQRGGCHAADDMTASLRASWPRLALFEAIIRNDKPKDAHWLWPLRIPTMDEPLVALMFVADGGFVAVKTFLGVSMLTPDQRSAVIAADETMGDVACPIGFVRSDAFDVLESMIEMVRTT